MSAGISKWTHRTGRCILGVKLVQGSPTNLCLGVVSLPEFMLAGHSVNNLRTQLSRQLQKYLPSNFTFRTRKGWPVLIEQEKDVPIEEIISEDACVYIERYFGMPRIGIMTQKGEGLGYLLAEYTLPLLKLRDLLIEQRIVNNVLPFLFLTSNGWPVSFIQEQFLQVMDVLNNSSICIMDDPPTNCALLDSIMDNLPSRKRKHSKSADNNCEEISAKSMNTVTTGNAKQILISYVRAEAAQVAISLKQELTALNISVFLDVDEIKTGADWQDSLNHAVSNCEIFIPLITQRYGLTRWSNREVKLADILGKFMLPINFLSEWPPSCLAIQLATTQYINGTRQSACSALSHEAFPTIYPNQDGIIVNTKMIAKEIAERLTTLKRNSLTRRPTLHRRETKIYNCALELPICQVGLTEAEETHQKLIVITLHQEQSEFGRTLQNWLEKEGLEVWLSTELDSSRCCQQNGSTPIEDLRKFQEKADEAAAIIFVLSDSYATSRTCMQQAFYCENRKWMLALKYENFEMPSWMCMLIGMLPFRDVWQSDFKEQMMKWIHKILNPQTRVSVDPEGVCEAKIKSIIRELKTSFMLERCIYILGKTELTEFDRNICMAIGKGLASVPNIHLVSSGCYGASQVICQSYLDSLSDIPGPKAHDPVLHILPKTDKENQNHRMKQNPDGTFPPLEFGKTFFYGDNTWQRDTMMSHAFELCILFEGSSDVSYITQQFVWNEHIVIPVNCYRNKEMLLEKIFECPSGVLESDWYYVTEDCSNYSLVGERLAKVVDHLMNPSVECGTPPLRGAMAKHLSMVADIKPFSKSRTSLNQLQSDELSMIRADTMVLTNSGML
ncbi:uncharacterized protein LOC106872313 isoform X1 [Octopus bimaculoides]|uniref:TIR domain-containing protein n=1 Tax=Octopus bimaculoides TaxID=37653 RepID=A0A0L8H900_OCTBM|nr:uncharacterized protein LOC106872313 isoform X1 [Octopus bimaculoides]|eukprot:XP_014774740.1 PREDICTED: uncharacterized protein LOC106872313 isoform X1 [Octopus bimaculoides]